MNEMNKLNHKVDKILSELDTNADHVSKMLFAHEVTEQLVHYLIKIIEDNTGGTLFQARILMKTIHDHIEKTETSHLAVKDLVNDIYRSQEQQ